MFRSGELSEKRLLINLYVDKAVVYREHVEIYLNMIPTMLKLGDLCGKEIAVSGLPLAHYILRLRKLYREIEKASILPFPIALETFDGGGEPAKEKVSDSEQIEAQAAKISENFNSSMCRRAIPMINPAEALIVIGRDTLNYCSSYGEE